MLSLKTLSEVSEGELHKLQLARATNELFQHLEILTEVHSDTPLGRLEIMTIQRISEETTAPMIIQIRRDNLFLRN